MPVDSQIPLQATGKSSGPDPLESAARVFTLKAAMQQAQLGDYELHDQLTLRDASGMPDVKNPDGTMNIPALLGHVTGKVSPKTMLTLTSAAQQQEQYKRQQQQFKQQQMASFMKASADPMASILTEYQQDAQKVGPEKAWEIAQPKTEALRTQLSQTFQGMNLQPMTSAQQLEAAARHSEAFVKNQMRGNQPETPHEQRMAGAAERRATAAEQKTQAGITGKGALSDDALNLAADQFLAGDNTAVQGYARNAQMKAQLTNRIAERAKAKGMSGEAVAAKVAEFQGFKAGQRALGTRQAQVDLPVQEAQNLVPLALKASDEMKRTNIRSVNDLINAAKSKTSSPELRRLAGATNSFINVYARAISPTGAPHDEDKKHARELLDVGFSKGDYKASIDQLVQEMNAAQEAPGQVKKRMRGEFIDKPSSGTPKRKRYNPDTGKIE